MPDTDPDTSDDSGGGAIGPSGTDTSDTEDSEDELRDPALRLARQPEAKFRPQEKILLRPTKTRDRSRWQMKTLKLFSTTLEQLATPGFPTADALEPKTKDEYPHLRSYSVILDRVGPGKGDEPDHSCCL